jgi:hypothetical protein
VGKQANAKMVAMPHAKQARLRWKAKQTFFSSSGFAETNGLPVLSGCSEIFQMNTWSGPQLASRSTSLLKIATSRIYCSGSIHGDASC